MKVITRMGMIYAYLLFLFCKRQYKRNFFGCFNGKEFLISTYLLLGMCIILYINTNTYIYISVLAVTKLIIGKNREHWRIGEKWRAPCKNIFITGRKKKQRGILHGICNHKGFQRGDSEL